MSAARYAYADRHYAPRWYETWPGRIAIAAIVAVVGAWVFGWCRDYIAEGRRVRDAMPPAVVVRHDHSVTSQSYSCGTNCVTTSNTDNWTLYDVQGRWCGVTQRQWATAIDGQPFKCQQLYGWVRP